MTGYYPEQRRGSTPSKRGGLDLFAPAVLCVYCVYLVVNLASLFIVASMHLIKLDVMKDSFRNVVHL